MKKKQFSVLFFAAFLPAAFALCQDSSHTAEAVNRGILERQWIYAVKHAVLEFDKGITIGDAFDYYKYFSAAPKWTVTESPNKRHIIEVSGTIDFKQLKPEEPAEIAGLVDYTKARQSDIDNGNNIMPPDENQRSLRKINQKFRGLQLIYNFQLNVDNSVECKDVTANLITTDNKIVRLVISSNENSYLGEIYNSKLPGQLIIETLDKSLQ